MIGATFFWTTGGEEVKFFADVKDLLRFANDCGSALEHYTLLPDEVPVDNK